MAGINKIGYSTHILGTVKSVMSCLGIILYNKYDISDGDKYKRISLYNINEIFNLVKKGPYLELTRETTDENDYFIYLHENGRIEGFNVIIYINPIDGSPLGYTEFTNTQGQDRDTNIYLELQAEVLDFDVRLNDNLDNVEYAIKTYTGKGLGDYTSAKDVFNGLKDVEKGNKHYTKFLSQSQRSNDSIYLDCGTVARLENLNGLGFIKLGLERNMNYSPLDYDFENFNISYYGDDIVLCSWTGTNYCITSLTLRNAFGDLIRYTKSNKGYFTLPSTDGVMNTIDHAAGKYIICKTTSSGNSRMRAFNIETKSWEETTNPNVFVDPLDKSNTLYELPGAIKSDSFFRYLPELKNMFYDYKENEYLKVIRKVGPWFVLNVKRNDKSLVLVTGIAFSLYLTPDQLKDLMFFDDNTLILNTKNAYLIYNGFRQTKYTKSASNLIGTKGKVLNTSVESVDKEQELYKTSFNDVRRGAYPQTKGLPEFVAGFKGHLFYVDKSNHIINFL